MKNIMYSLYKMRLLKELNDVLKLINYSSESMYYEIINIKEYIPNKSFKTGEVLVEEGKVERKEYEYFFSGTRASGTRYNGFFPNSSQYLSEHFKPEQITIIKHLVEKLYYIK